MSSHAKLAAASDDRKARLAQLKSLKRKQDAGPDGVRPDDDEAAPSLKRKSRSRSPSPGVAARILSGRNFDAETRGPKLGYESAPDQGQDTVEAQAARLAAETKKLQEEEQKADKPLDLFKLQPKKPNWDLKRDLGKKLEVLNVHTDNAIARLVRERIQKAQKEARANGASTNKDGEALGMEGNTLVEAMHQLEREEEEDERREKEEFDV